MSSSPDGTKTRIITLPDSLMYLAWGSSRAVADALLYPVDTVKTRLQSSPGFQKTGGFRNLYRGLLPASVGCVPTAVLGRYLHNSSSMPEEEDLFANALSVGVGACTRELAASVIHVPFEVIKQRRQTEATSTLQLIKSAFRNEGIFGIYRGFLSTAVLDFAVVGLTLPLVVFFTSTYSVVVERPLNVLDITSCGLLGGCLGAFLTTPLDVGRTRIMLYKLSEDSMSSSRRVPSLISTLRSIYHDQGLRGLYAGCLPRTLVLPFGVIIFDLIHFSVLSGVGLIYANKTIKEENKKTNK